MVYDPHRLELRGLALRDRLAALSEPEALALLATAGNVVATRDRKGKLFARFLTKRLLTPNPVHAAMSIILEDLRRGLAATTLLGRMRDLEAVLWQHMIAKLRDEPEWVGTRRTLARSLGAAPLPKPTLPWPEMQSRARRLDPARRIAAALMIATAARYATVVAMRVGDLLCLGRNGPMWAVLRHDKVRSPAYAYTYAIPPRSWIERLLAPLAISPAKLRATWGRVQWVDRPRLTPFPQRWEKGGPRARDAPLEARVVRRAVIARLLEAGNQPTFVASWVGHSLLTQRGVYRDAAPPSPAELELALQLAAD